MKPILVDLKRLRKLLSPKIAINTYLPTKDAFLCFSCISICNKNIHKSHTIFPSLQDEGDNASRNGNSFLESLDGGRIRIVGVDQGTIWMVEHD